MAVKTFTTGEVLTASDTNTYLANSGLVVVTPSGATNGTVSGSKVTIGTAVSSVTVSGVFSSTYDAYKVVVSGGSSSATNVDLSLNLGSSTTTYYYSLVYSSYASGTAAAAVSNGTAGYFGYVGEAMPDGIAADFDLINPYLVKYTSLRAGIARDSLAGSLNGVHKTAASYTAFTLTPSSGTLTGGTIMVYGYRLG